MSRLEEIQEAYAKGKGFSSYFIMYCGSNYTQAKKYSKEITEIYVKECCQASLEKASEKVSIDENFSGVNINHWINKESITNPENIVLL